MERNSIIIAFAAAALLPLACKSGGETQVQKPEVSVITLKDTTCTIQYRYPATIRGIQDVAIFPQVSGRITAVKVSEGQFVEKGQTLFTIDPVPYQSAYDAAVAEREVAKSQVASAKLTLESKQNLYDREVISEYQLKLAKNQLLTAEAVLGQANAAVQKAANDLSFTHVKTMISGYVGGLPYKIGSLVGPQIDAPLTIISDNSSIYTDFSLPENTYLELVEGTKGAVNLTDFDIPLELITNNGILYEHKGHVKSANGLISRETGALPVRGIFPNPERRLLSGGSCQIVFNSEQDNVILIPRAAIKEIQDKMFVFKVNDGKLEQTEVSAMRLDESNWLLLPGISGEYPLKAGDVITSTTNRMQNEMEVTVKSSKS